MQIDRVNEDTNAYYNQIEENEARQRMNESDKSQAEAERVESLTERLMGGDDPDLLAEVLAENPSCVEALAVLCEFSTRSDIDDMTLREVGFIARVARLLTISIQIEVKKGVAAGHYK